MPQQKNPAENTVEILVVEDSPIQAEHIKHLLEQNNYSVTVADTGEHALAFLEKRKPALIISDIIMPEMNGFELCRRIKASENSNDIPVILLTTLSESGDVLEGLACGADNFITKPYSEKYFLKHVEQAIANRALQKSGRANIAAEILFWGKRRVITITAEKQQMLTLLISTYEAAVQRNSELLQTQDELRSLNEHLEDLVNQRTAALSTEITERKRAEEVMRESEERYRALFESINDAVFVQYAEGDSLLDLINLAHGLTLDVNLSQAEIVRFGSDNKTTESVVIPIKELIIDNQRDKNLPLLPDDRVFIRSIPKFHEKKQATILGEVLYPGVYAVEEGKTKLSELVSLAGGFTPLSSLAEAEMIRQTPEQVVDLEFERLKKMDVADMSKTEYEYFKTKSREKPGRVACDFEKLFVKHQAEQDILLKDGDIINIPAKSLVVKVSGNVVNPGLIEYEPGKDYAYYIKKAGGFSFKARKGKVRIIKGITGEWIKPSKSQRIDPGDAVWIPEKPDRDYWAFFKDAMIVLGNMATIYLVVKSATD